MSIGLHPDSEEAVREWLAREVFAKVYQPVKPLDILAWIRDEKPELDSQESQEHFGPYDPYFTGYNMLLFKFLEHPKARELFICKGSQEGVTLAALIGVLAKMAHTPGNAMYVLNNATEMKKVSKARLQPLLRSLGVINTENEDKQENLTLYLPQGLFYLLGAQTSGSFRQKSSGVCVLDELDDHPFNIGGEGGTVDLARGRLKTVDDSKLIGFSTPITHQHPTWQEVAKGNILKYHVPCPHCGTKQTIELEGFRYDHCRKDPSDMREVAAAFDMRRVLGTEGKPSEVYLECKNDECRKSECQGRIEEHHKAWMTDPRNGAEWIPTQECDDDELWTAQISDFYSPFKKVAWGQLIKTWILAMGNPGKIANWWNTHGGLPHTADTTTHGEKEILACCDSHYEQGKIPAGVPIVALLITADRQGDRIKWMTCGWTLTDECYIIDYGDCLGYKELAAQTDHGYAWPGTGELFCASFGLIDEGHLAQQVRRFCYRQDGRWFPSKGVGMGQGRRTAGGVSTSEVEVQNLEGGAIGEILLYRFDNPGYSETLYNLRISKRAESIKRGQGGIHLFNHPPEDLVDELCSEQFRETGKRFGRPVMGWAKTGANDQGDCLKGQQVLWDLVKGKYITAAKGE